MGLVTLAEIKDFAKVVGTADDAFLQMQIDLTSDAIEEFCKRRFGVATYSETFLSADLSSNSLTLYHYPVIEVQAINGLALTGNQYVLHKPSGKLRAVYASAFYGYENTAMVVQYKAGFDPVPSPIKFAVMSIVAGNYNKKKNGIDLSFGSDVQRMSIPGTISIDFDYSLQNNEPQTEFGLILGSLVNVINPYVSDRAIMGQERLAYVEVVP